MFECTRVDSLHHAPRLCAGWLPSAAAETHPFSVHDMLAMERISDPQVSPGRQPDRLRRCAPPISRPTRARTDLWLVGTDGTGCAG